jgi:hypothetical protein
MATLDDQTILRLAKLASDSGDYWNPWLPWGPRWSIFGLALTLEEFAKA